MSGNGTGSPQDSSSGADAKKMKRSMKGTFGLAAVLDLVDRVRPALLTAAALLAAGSVAAPFVLEDHHTVTHANSALLSAATLMVAFALPPRTAVGAAVVAATYLVAVNALLGVEALMALPVASLIVMVTILITMVRKALQTHEEASDALHQHRLDLEDALAISYRQVLYAEALSTAARAYLTPTGQDQRAAALSELLNATDTDIVRVTRNVRETEEQLTAIVESSGCSNAFGGWDDRGEIVWTRFPTVMTGLAAGKPHMHGSLAEVPYPDRQEYESIGMPPGAGMDVPIMVDGHWQGTLSISSIDRSQPWRDGEIALLKSVADMIGSSWTKEHTLVRLNDAIDQRDRSLRLQAALTDSSRTLLESESENPLVEALSIIRAAVGVTSAYLETSSDGPGGPTRTTLHCVAPVADETAAQRNGLWSAWPYAYAELSEGRPYIIDDIDQLPDRERAWYMTSQSPIRAELSFPVTQDGRLVAVVGIGHNETRRWTASEMRMMGSVARMIGAYWQRDSVRQALEDLIKAKDRFLASVSHELRTPMAVVLGLSSELNTRREDFSDEETSEFIDLIARQAREVTHIIEDLLVSARATETGITVLPEPVRLDHQVDEVLAALPIEHTFKVRKVDIGEIVVMADPFRTRQILRNLIINSHRHGGDHVIIEGRLEGDLAHILVHDDGPGVPDDRVEEIFEAYATSGERAGMTAAIGLGLTVSRQLARIMGGDVVYRRGDLSTFDLSLPGVTVESSVETPSEQSAGVTS